MQIDEKRIRAYGDTFNDGQVQLSFSLPVEHGPRGDEAARILAGHMGLEEVEVAFSRDLGQGFSYYIVYGRCPSYVDLTQIQITQVEVEAMDYYEINRFIEERMGRPLVVVGACTGTDAHTVGLDAIMNMKGYAGEYGLERYPQFEAYNMGSQVPNSQVISRAVEVEADVILISQVVTQKNVHLENLTNLVELLEAEGLREKFLLIVGGPRISHEMALELGFDAGFGSGTLPPQVATYIAREIYRRQGSQSGPPGER